jgi:hypothetical protein
MQVPLSLPLCVSTSYLIQINLVVSYQQTIADIRHLVLIMQQSTKTGSVIFGIV